MGNQNFLIAGGGTGGHLFPALAIGEELHRRNPNSKIHYVGSNFGLEAKVFPVKDVRHTLLPIRGLQRGLNPKSIGRNILLPGRIFSSMAKIRSLFKDFIPEIIIGTGGYASAVPLFMATRWKKTCPIVLQEQNSFPGITTRWFAPRSKTICTAFEETSKYLEHDTILTGNPVRQGIAKGRKKEAGDEFNLDPKLKTIFLFGGSQGSAYLNKMMDAVVKKFNRSGLQVLWQTGDMEYPQYKKYNQNNIHVSPFINNMDRAYAIADLIICRSGALTLAEITVCGKASILIPFPFAAADHQTKNAQALVNSGAARILFQKTLRPKEFYYSITNLIHNQIELERMALASKSIGRPNATKEIVDQIIKATS